MDYYHGIELSDVCKKALNLLNSYKDTSAYQTVYRFATGINRLPEDEWIFKSQIITKGDFYENYKQNRTLFPLDWRRTGFKGIHRWR